MPERIAGVIERVTFHNPDNGFSVLRVTVGGRHDQVTIVGNLPAVSKGERVEATGEWKRDRTHGLQFHAETLAIEVPTSRRGIERYLASGQIRGVGSHLAKLIVKQFGDKTLEVLEKHPQRLERVSGIGPKRARSIAESWASQKAVRDLMVFLQSHGVGAARAHRIHKQYGDNAIGLIRENPYRLADDVRGVGFRSADAIARSLGLEPTSIFRARAGIGWILSEASSTAGHCGLPREELVESAVRLLGIPAERIEEALRLEVAAGRLVADDVGSTPVIFLQRLWRAEKEIGERLRQLSRGAPPWAAIAVDKAVPWVESRLQLQLAPTQREALRAALGRKVTVITGGPGVGKTTLVNSLITILAAKKVKIALAAPTGRAAKRLTESTGRTAKTIHRLLEVNARTFLFARDESNPLECDLLVVDETSMIDVSLMQSLLRAVPPRAALLLVGDVDQLPSVGPGQVLADVISSHAVPVMRMTEIFRQAAESRIVVNAHRVNQGEMPQLEASPGKISDFYFIATETPDQTLQRILQVVCERIPARFGLDPLRDIQVLAPMNRGTVGVQSLNAELQRALNPAGLASRQRLERFGSTFCVGDKVMQIENDYDKEVFNGDLGLIRAIDPEKSAVAVEIEGRTIHYEHGDLDQLVLAYATTIHKAQGSEYPAVVIPLVNQHHIMLQRNLLYTAITRGRRLVILVGQKQAVGAAVRNRESRTRWTKLREWLAG